MSFIFTPASDEELAALDQKELLEPGIYEFEVYKSDRKHSKSGNVMAALQLKVWNEKHPKVGLVFDFLVFTQVNLNLKKISHFCKAVGLQEEYKKGELPDDLTLYCGKLELGIDEGQPKPEGGCYPKKNIVIDYIKAEGESFKPVKQNVADPAFNDDIPF